MYINIVYYVIIRAPDCIEFHNTLYNHVYIHTSAIAIVPQYIPF